MTYSIFFGRITYRTNKVAQFVKSKKHFEDALRERTTKDAY